jgi:hypothetical protein
MLVENKITHFTASRVQPGLKTESFGLLFPPGKMPLSLYYFKQTGQLTFG